MAVAREVLNIDAKLEALKLEILRTFDELCRNLVVHRDNLLSRPGLPIQSNPIDNPIQSIHIWTIENPRLDNRLLGSQSNRNSQSTISSMFLDCFFDCFWIVFWIVLDCFLDCFWIVLDCLLVFYIQFLFSIFPSWWGCQSNPIQSTKYMTIQSAIQSTKYRTIQSTIQSMEKMAIKNRESCRLDWIGIPGLDSLELKTDTMGMWNWKKRLTS